MHRHGQRRRVSSAGRVPRAGISGGSAKAAKRGGEKKVAPAHPHPPRDELPTPDGAEACLVLHEEDVADMSVAVAMRHSQAEPPPMADKDLASWFEERLKTHQGEAPPELQMDLDAMAAPEKQSLAEARSALQSTIFGADCLLTASQKEDALDALLSHGGAAFGTALQPGKACTAPPLRFKFKPGAKPKSFTRRVPDRHHAEVDKQVKDWLRMGIVRPIDPSDARLFAPMVIVAKADASVRLCFDQFELNEAIYPIDTPMPNAAEIIEWCADAKYIVKLDMCSGFFQILLHEDSQPYACFWWNGKAYAFQRTFFGGRTCPSYFQAVMNKVLAEFISKDVARCYVDDILIKGNSLPELWATVRDVMGALVRAQLVVKTTKVTCCRRYTDVLGMVVGAGTIRAHADTIEKLRTAPRPTTKKQLRNYLGLSNFLRGVIPRYATLTKPLHAMAHPDGPRRIKWEDETSTAFDRLRAALVHPHVLRKVDTNRPLHVFSDASNVAVGAVAAQRDDTVEAAPFYAVRYLSQTLKGPMVRWAPVERECYAAIWSVTSLGALLSAAKFVLHTDCQALRWLYRQLHANNSKCVRWCTLLSRYDVSVQYTPGPLNGGADALSRPPISDAEGRLAPPTLAAALLEPWPTITADAQAKDSAVAALMQALQAGQPPPAGPRGLRWSQMQPSLDKEGRLVLRPAPQAGRAPSAAPPRLYVPKAQRGDVLDVAHSGRGCFGFTKSWPALRERFWWPTCRSDLVQFIKDCRRCDQLRSEGHPQQQPLLPSAPPERFARVHLDHMGPISAKAGTLGNKPYVVVAVCASSKFVVAEAVESKAWQHLHPWLQRICGEHGYPAEFRTDNDSVFNCTAFREWCERRNILLTHSSPNHPRGNGQVEAFVKVLKRGLAKYAGPLRGDWALFLPDFVAATNAAVHSDTGLSPFFCHYGRHPSFGGDHHRLTISEDADTFNRLAEELAAAAQRWVQAMDSAKRTHDKRASLAGALAVGDLVWLRAYGAGRGLVAPALAIPWTGPFVIVTLLQGHKAAVRSVFEPEAEPSVAHRADLRRVKASYDAADYVRPNGAPADHAEVAEIVDHYVDGDKTVWFGVRWAGQHRYQPKSPKSWVKTSDLKADELVRLYWARQQAADGQDQLHVARRGQLASARNQPEASGPAQAEPDDDAAYPAPPAAPPEPAELKAAAKTAPPIGVEQRLQVEHAVLKLEPEPSGFESRRKREQRLQRAVAKALKDDHILNAVFDDYCANVAAFNKQPGRKQATRMKALRPADLKDHLRQLVQ